MTAEEKELSNRATELASRSQSRGIYTRSHFLTEGEQAFLKELRLPCQPIFDGGYPEAERCLAVFGSYEELGYEEESPIRLLKIEPKDRKFADALSHRDYLGAILHLGIRRELLGDLILWDNAGYLFCMDSVCSYLLEEIRRVRHTDVRVSLWEALPQEAASRLEEQELICASPRLDALVSAVFSLSRGEGKELVEKEKVSLAGKLCTDASREAKAGERISVRGFGRFYYDGICGETRKGKSRIRVRKYI